MKIADANVLLHAVNRDSDHHEAAREWLDSARLKRRPSASRGAWFWPSFA